MGQERIQQKKKKKKKKKKPSSSLNSPRCALTRREALVHDGVKSGVRFRQR